MSLRPPFQEARIPVPNPVLSTAADDARDRLVVAGLNLFSQQGFANTSTRELAEAAKVNISAISYYFGDKAGLYRAVFFEPLDSAQDDVDRYSAPSLPLAQALEGFFSCFLEPLKQGDRARLSIKLRFREMLEPTGLWEEEMRLGIKPMHDAMVELLCRQFQLEHADAEVHRLAVCLAGLGVHMHVGRDCTDVVAPGLNDDLEAVDLWSQCLVRCGLAMVQAEQSRRQLLALPPDGPLEANAS